MKQIVIIVLVSLGAIVIQADAQIVGYGNQCYGGNSWGYNPYSWGPQNPFYGNNAGNGWNRWGLNGGFNLSINVNKTVNQQPMYQQPVYQQPVYQQPVYVPVIVQPVYVPTTTFIYYQR